MNGGEVKYIQIIFAICIATVISFSIGGMMKAFDIRTKVAAEKRLYRNGLNTFYFSRSRVNVQTSKETVQVYVITLIDLF